MQVRKKASQHFVPQLILRNFAFNKKGDQIWAFNKKTSEIFSTNIRKVAAEKGFYDVIVDGKECSSDPVLTQLESYSGSIIRRLIQEENLSNLSGDDKLVLSYFFAAQYARTRQLRMLHEDLSKKMDSFIRMTGADPNRAIGHRPFTTNGAKEHTVRALPHNIFEFAPYFFIKDWILLKTSQDNPFWISDNPIAMHNTIDHGPFGNIGLAVEGIEIYFPLSNTLTLLMLCDSTANKVCFVYEQLKMNPLLSKLAEAMCSNSLGVAGYEMISEGIRTKKAMNIPHDYLIRLNSLQVIYASELIFSSTNKFKLAQEMIEHDASYRERPKLS